MCWIVGMFRCLQRQQLMHLQVLHASVCRNHVTICSGHLLPGKSLHAQSNVVGPACINKHALAVLQCLHPDICLLIRLLAYCA